MSSRRDDPRDASLAVPATRPPLWKESADAFGSSTMMLGGLTMVSRSAMVAWTTLAIGLWSYLNAHPLRTKDGGSAGQGMIFAVGALIASYFPRFVVQPSLSASGIPE